MVDSSSIFPGNRGVNRHGAYGLYDAPVGVKLRIEPCHKSDPILIAETEWEDGGAVSPSHVWQADGRYHMLYWAYPANTVSSHMCYAVSGDGYRWERPHLHQVEFNGSTQNNLIADPPTGTPFRRRQRGPIRSADQRLLCLHPRGRDGTPRHRACAHP